MKIISFHTLITIFWSTISLSNRNAIFAFSDISKTTINNIDIIQSYNEGIVESLALPSINTSLLRPIKSKTELVSNRYLRNITTTTNPNITIERYDVYNSITDQRIIINLIDNAIINLHTYNLSSPNDINIRAIVRGKPLRSIKFSIMNSGNNDNNKTNINIIKNKRPYGLCGNTNRTDYNKCTGMFDEVDTTYTITGTPYSMINGTGRQGASVTKTFQIKLDQCMTPKVSFNFIISLFQNNSDDDWNEKIHNYYELTVDLTYFFVSCFCF